MKRYDERYITMSKSNNKTWAEPQELYWHDRLETKQKKKWKTKFQRDTHKHNKNNDEKPANVKNMYVKNGQHTAVRSRIIGVND